MMNLASFRLVAFSTAVLIVFSSLLIANVLAQVQVVPNQSKLTTTHQINQTFTLVETLYGINDTTGKVVFFGQVGKVIEGKVLDATLADKLDKNKDGILEVGLTFYNSTIKAGDKFRACTIVLDTLQISCAIGHKSARDRAEYIDFVVDGKNSTTAQSNTILNKENVS